MKYYRVDVINENEIITVCTTTNKKEAEHFYDVYGETFSVKLIENDTDTMIL